MSGNVEQQRLEKMRNDIAALGPADANRLHRGMNNSDDSKAKRENQQPNLATGKRDGQPGGSTSQSVTSTSGSKRHASPGAGPSEPTATTARREAKRATVTNEEGNKTSAPRPTHRNDIKSQVEPRQMNGSSRRAKPNT